MNDYTQYELRIGAGFITIVRPDGIETMIITESLEKGLDKVKEIILREQED